jgi:hypothetical protein
MGWHDRAGGGIVPETRRGEQGLKVDASTPEVTLESRVPLQWGRIKWGRIKCECGGCVCLSAHVCVRVRLYSVCVHVCLSARVRARAHVLRNVRVCASVRVLFARVCTQAPIRPGTHSPRQRRTCN